jgi:eukaryotic-like serine/threonine-protein kinase
MSERKALIVGINTYPFSPLSNCVNDAQEIAFLLEQPEYGFDVTLLLDQQVTRRSLRMALTALFSGAPNFVVLYFAGHGLTDDVGSYLATVDSDEVDLGIDMELLKRLITAKAAVDTNVVLLLRLLPRWCGDSSWSRWSVD